ncbi:polysaccharide deacetylase family protein [Ochrobactrum sp. BTU1]|nr:polysaccharide deacetylase family protein [Brucella sp. NBRC 12950]QWK80213.1 polysaccharide deacetylase family protein [Ochrobactrum sp. BTU1]
MVRLQSFMRNMRYAAIRRGLDAIAFSGLGKLFPSSGGRGVIFTLHHIGADKTDEFRPNSILSVTPEFLTDTIDIAFAAGLVPVHLHDLPALLSNKSDNRKFVAFTFDDGYRNNAEIAAPIFHKFGIPYTVFPTMGFVDRTHTIWWETTEALLRKTTEISFDFGRGPETLCTKTVAQKYVAFDRLAAFVRTFDEDEAVRQIDDLAVSQCDIDPRAIVDSLVMNQTELKALATDPLAHIGGHTITHVNLRRVSEERLTNEIKASQAAIEQVVGYRPKSFSYPYGWCSAVGEREIEMVAKAGFQVAVTTQPAVLQHSDALRPTAIKRISLNGDFQKQRYVKALISGLAFKFL